MLVSALACQDGRYNICAEKLQSAQFRCVFQVLHFDILVTLPQGLKHLSKS